MKLTLLAGIALVALAGPFQGAAWATDITGAGGTFPAPVYAAWASAYKSATGSSVNYQPIGSGGGQTQITNRTVDFGASDAPMDAAKLQSAKLVQFPTVIGAVVPIVNLPGIASNQLKLSGPVLADIFAGKVTSWNDDAIAKLNPGVTLPSTDIAPVYRSDGSGTSFVFTSYLSAVSPDWKSQVGAATAVQWPTGTGAKGNAGIASTVKNTEGAIGYVEYAFAAQNGLTIAQLQNKAGSYVQASTDSFKAAAGSADWTGAKNFAVSMVDTSGAQAWPIVTTTFVLLPMDPKDADKSAGVMKFFDWAYSNGSSQAEKLNYVMLPQDVVAKVHDAWKGGVMADGKPVYAQ